MHALAALILALTVVTTPNDALSLRSGERIPVSGTVTMDGNRAIFRHADGTLYSIPIDEIDVTATEAPRPAAAEPRPRTAAEDRVLEDLIRAAETKSISSRTLVVSEDEKQRLLVELRKSRGTPEPARPYVPIYAPDSVAPVSERAATSRHADEWYWREKARVYNEAVLRRREDLQMLIDKERNLSDEILGLLSLGYDGNQFSYQVLSLARTRDRIPQARLELERAERARAQFMDDARRQNILPGWLR
ncbi:MAG: hypothetical protein ACSLFQ_05855 [Thermoanaerobaculia bacterium]